MEGDPRIGAVLGGKYRIERKLGEGGMGAVYAAVQEPLGRKVALKVLLPVLARDVTLVGRFQREAELAASLGHPNIVQVTDFGVDDGSAFLVMDLLEGESLGGVLERERVLAPERVRFIATQVLSALGAAHARGVVHRDLKPDNVYLTSVSGVSDLVKLLDFGIARLTEGSGDQKMTATGQVLGTPAYMSPEQARGKPVDARSDLYALGVLMYEALSGRMPVNGSNYHELMFAIVGETPTPLSELVPELDPGLVGVVERAMAKDPNTRYANADAMRAALDALGPLQVTSPARVPSMPPTRDFVPGSAGSAADYVPGSAGSAADYSDAAMGATITPEALAAVSAPSAPSLPKTAATPSDATPAVVAAMPSAAMPTPAAVPAMPSAAPPPRRSGTPWLAAALVVGLIGGGAAFALLGRDGAPPPTTVDAPTPERPTETAPVDDEAAREAEIEAAAEARAREIAERVLRETAERMAEEAPSMATDMAVGAPDSVVAEQARARETEAPSRMRRAAPAAARTRMVRCGDNMREYDVVQPGDTVNVTFRQTNNVVPMESYRALTSSWTPQLTSCYVGHPAVGGMFTIEVDASGRITKLRRNPFCDAPAALERCLEGFIEGAAAGNETGAPGEMRFDINHRPTR
ncbi:MAG: protein kinase [Sandaracinus sp.]|nr:protein kinase [Sandaracinus sp.]MCB9625256.1 protein kinase [Sandaracinus sp.]